MCLASSTTRALNYKRTELASESPGWKPESRYCLILVRARMNKFILESVVVERLLNIFELKLIGVERRLKR